MKSEPPSAAVVCFSPLHRDARVQRQIRALASICRVTAMAFTDPGIAGIRFVDLGSGQLTMPQKAVKACRLKARRFEAVYRSHEPVRRAAAALKDHDFALIVANDIDTLPLALTHRRQAKVLFDAHEYAPREHEDWFLWRFFIQRYKEYLCKTRIPQVDAMLTVGPAIAEEYTREFGVRPSVVLNAPHYEATPCAPHDGGLIRMVHLGGAIHARRLEIMIDAMAQLDDRFQLDFILLPVDAAYLSRLKRRASGDARISFFPAVAPDEIVSTISQYDVGLYSLPPYSFNARHALPNKLFEFIQARLCVAVGPSPEMKRIVEHYECGVVAKDFTPDALAETLRALDRQTVEAYRRAADVAAAELCYERSAEVLLDTVRGLLGLDVEVRANREDGVTGG